MLSFIELLRLGASLPGIGPCFTGPKKEDVSFEQLWNNVDHLASALAARGLEPGDRVALLGTDSAEYMTAVLACLQIGLVYFPLNYRLATGEIHALLDHARPAVVFAADRYIQIVETAPLTARPRVTISLDSERRDVTSLAGLVAERHSPVPEHVTLDEDVVAVCYTSGTTGRPKGVMQSQRAMKAEFWRHSQFFAAPGDVRYSASPMFHVAGHRTLFNHIARGCTSVLMTQFDPCKLATLIAEDRLDGAFLVPTMLDQLLTTMGDRRARLPLLLYGGAPMSSTLLSRVIDAFDSDLYNLFGSTEAGLLTLLGPDDHRAALAGSTHLLGSLGRPSIAAHVRLCGPSGEEVAIGDVGELVCRTDGAMTGYLDDPHETASVLREGWLWTGDLARRDDDGYYFYAGRTRDVIIRGGENIYPNEIEDVITALAGVSAAAVIGVADERWGEVVVAYVEHQGPPPSADEVLRHCREHLGSYKVPSSVVFTSELPRTAAGKVAKNLLRRDGM